EASFAVQVTVGKPSGNVVPLAGEHVTDGCASHRSVAVGVANVTLAPAPLVCSTTMSAGLVRAGGVVSFTVMVKLVVLVLPEASLAVQVTVVTPRGNVVPLAGEHVTL